MATKPATFRRRFRAGVPPTSDSVQLCWNDEDDEGTTWIPLSSIGDDD